MAIDKKRKARAESHTKKVKKRKEEREMEMVSRSTQVVRAGSVEMSGHVSGTGRW